MSRTLPHDKTLPHLEVAFDCGRMRQVLQKAIDPHGTAGWRVRDCSIARSKYRLGRNCMMLYRASICDGSGGPLYEQLFSCGIYAGEDALARYRKALATPLVLPRVGAAIAHVPAHNMVVWAYPNDRKLGALPLLADDDRLIHDLLPEVVEARWGARRKIASIRTAIAGYFPEHALCLKVGIRFADQPEGDEWIVYGKAGADDRGADTLAAMRMLRESDAHRAGALGMALPLCYQADYRLIWQEGVPGRTVESLLVDGALARPLLMRAGAAVGELHGQRLPGLRTVSTIDLLATLRDSARLLGLAAPPLDGRLQRLAQTLHDQAVVVEPYQTTLHGDLHLNNMLADGDELYLVDFDSLRCGAPAIELGSFVAALHYRAALHGVSEHCARDDADAFLSAYEAVAARAVPKREVAWHASAALVHERMSRCLTSLKPGRFELMEQLLALAETLCDQSAPPRTCGSVQVEEVVLP